MPCYEPEPTPEDYTKPLRAEIEKLKDQNKWLNAALCLMTHPDVTSVATSQFLKYIQAIKPELWKESGIRANDLLAWKEAHTAEDIKRRALEKLTPEERKVLGLS